MRQKLFLLCLLLGQASMEAHASFPEFFGASPTTSSIGSQANTDFFDPSNAYYAGALVAFGDKISLNVSYDYITHDFTPITGITVRNDSNSATGTELGNALTKYGEFRHSSIHAVLPIKYPGAGNLVVNLFAPVGNIIETNTGHPTLPEYVFYHARYKRTELFVQYAHPFSSNFAISLGAYAGFQVAADMAVQASLTGENFGSSAAAKANVSPALAGLLSMAYRLDNWTTYFAFQQEMKSHLDANVTGGTDSPPIPFDIKVESLPYYDPSIFRLGLIRKGETLSLMGMVEYQMWENYQTPIVRITQRASVKSSDNFESLQTKNILVPKIGMLLDFTDSFALMAGLAYRPTPIKGDFSGAGNSIDTNKTILSSGLKFSSVFFSRPLEFSGSLQWHRLEEKTVSKTTGQENGNAGTKIGGPFYTIGGSVYMATVGLKTSF